MKKLIFLAIAFIVLLAYSCKKHYKYIEVVEVKSGNSVRLEKLPSKIITASSDEEAYLIAYTYICHSTKVFMDYTEAEEPTQFTPVEFLLFKGTDSVNIANSIEFKDKDIKQNAIARQIFNMPNYVKIDKDLAKQQAEKKAIQKEEMQKKLSKLKEEHDDVSGITWYYQKYFTHYINTNRISLYIGKKSNSVWLRLKMTYNGDNWIFFENAYISYEGNTQPIYFDRYNDRNTEIEGGFVSEWLDVDISKDKEIINFLYDFAKSTQAKMKLSGKYSKTRTLTQNERQGILDVLEGYDILIQK